MVETILTLKASSGNPEYIRNTPLAPRTPQGLFEGQPHLSVVQLHTILGEEVGELLRPEATFVVVRVRIAAMLGAAYMRKMDAEQGVGKPLGGRLGDVGEAAVDENDGDDAHKKTPSEEAEGNEAFPGADDAVGVEVEEVAVLLKDLRKACGV